jgi:hypothetical protein
MLTLLPVTQKTCIFCGSVMLGMNNGMRRRLLIRIILDWERLHQDSSGKWMMRGRPGFRFCDAHQIFDEFGRVFDIDFNALPDRVKEMESYLRQLKQRPEQYVFLKDIQERMSSRRRAKDFSPIVYVQTEYTNCG